MHSQERAAPVPARGSGQGPFALINGERAGVTPIGSARAGKQSLPLRAALERLATRLLQAPAEAADEAVRETLEGLTRVLGVDRCGLAQFTDGWTLHLTHGFAMPGIPAWQAVDFASLPWYTAQLREGRRLVWARLPEDLPPEATAEAELAAAIGLKSS